MRWSDDEFRARVAKRAADLGMSQAQLLEKAGVSKEVFYKVPSSGRRLDTIEKIADACQWTLAEVMGFVEPEILVEKMQKAYAKAEEVMAAVPLARRSTALLVEAMCYLYEELLASEKAGESSESIHLTAQVRILARALVPRNSHAEATETKPPKRRSVKPT